VKRLDIFATFLLENLKGREHLRDLGADGRKTLKWIINKYGMGVWTGFKWLRIGSSGGLLCTW
jgi:hypothetical protein